MNMRQCLKTVVSIGVFTALLLVIAALPALAAPPLSGAIFTTTVNGDVVNGNTKYELKCDVYLDGGPGPNAPQTAAGLPDGDYFFQVTDPSGKFLLSTDAVKYRQINVAGGIITGLSGLGNHGTGLDIDHPPAKTIQLCPFENTPNNGGVYKVWVTQVADFSGNINLVDNGYVAGNYFHGFIPSKTKTDNFKVKDTSEKPLFCLSVFKKLRDNKGSITDTSGWEYFVYDFQTGVTNGPYYTLGSKDECEVDLVAGKYTVTETVQTGYSIYSATFNGKPVSPVSSSVTFDYQTGDINKNANPTIVFTNNNPQ